MVLTWSVMTSSLLRLHRYQESDFNSLAIATEASEKELQLPVSHPELVSGSDEVPKMPKQVRHDLFVVRHSFPVVRHDLFVVRHSFPVVRHGLFVFRHDVIVVKHDASVIIALRQRNDITVCSLQFCNCSFPSGIMFR